MATTTYFDETIRDQGGRGEMDVEFGRSSFYSGSPLQNGLGQDSIYLTVNGETVIMDLVTARKFVEAVIGVGCYFGLVK
jgi:hypothetical protein